MARRITTNTGMKARFMATGAARFPYFRLPMHLPGIIAAASASSLSPVQVCKAYGLPKLTGLPTVKLGVVSLGGAITPTDAATAFHTWGLTPPKLTAITTPGGGQQSDPGGADVEAALDWQLQAATWAYMTGQAADVTVCFSPNTGKGIADAAMALANAGCGVVSISWGAPESGWTAADRAYTEAQFAACLAKGCWLTAASGDNSTFDGTQTPTCDYPAGSASVLAVGGTRLTIASDGSRATESAWGDGRGTDEGGGGGVDPNTPRPSYQPDVGQGAFMLRPDVSANADPFSGWQIMSGGQWLTVGGTSASAPFWAGLLAVLKAVMISKQLPQPSSPAPTIYANVAVAIFDIVTGSNGQPAKAGLDESSGLGVPIGPGILAAFTGAGTVPPPPGPTPPGPTPTGPTLQQVEAADVNVFGRLQRAFRNVRGSAPVLNAGLTDLERQHAALFVGAHDIEGEAVEPYPSERVSL